MITGIQGFSCFQQGTFAGVTELSNNISSVLPQPGGGEAARVKCNYYSSSGSVTFSSPFAKFGRLDGTTNDSAALAVYLTDANVLKDVGDTITVGCQVVFPETASDGVLKGGVITNAAGSANNEKYTILRYGDGTRNPYLELQVTRSSDGSLVYTTWVNGIKQVHTVPGAYAWVFLGFLRRTFTTSPTTLSIGNIYVAYNKEGREERIGPCTVMKAKTSISSGEDNPNGEGANNKVIDPLLFTTPAGTEPTTLVSPLVQKIDTTGLPDSSKIMAVSLTTVGKSSALGTSVAVTSRIVGGNGEDLAKSTVNNPVDDYHKGISSATLDTSDKTKSEIASCSLVSQGG